MLRECLVHAWNRTFSVFGGITLLITVCVLQPMGFVFHFLVEGFEPMAGEFKLWVIYTIATLGSAGLAVFLMSLACAPFQIERGKRLAAEAKIAALASRLGSPSPSPPTWEAWRARSRFSILEAAYLMAGREPRDAPAEGPVLAYRNELIWAVHAGTLCTLLLRPKHMTSIIDEMSHNGRLLDILGPREVADSELIEAATLRAYLASRPDDLSRQALANLSEAERPLSLPTPGAGRRR